MILGGQHILKALRKLRADYQAEGKPLPPSLEYCMMEVVTQGAPLGLRQLLAGDHQRTQANSESASTADFFRCALDEAVRRKTKGQTPYMTEGDVWRQIRMSGMKTEEKLANNPDMSRDEIDIHNRILVCIIPDFRQGSAGTPACIMISFHPTHR